MSGHAGRKRPRSTSAGAPKARGGAGPKGAAASGGAAKRSRVEGRRPSGGLTAKEAKQRAYDRLDGEDISIGGGSDSEGDLGLDDDDSVGSGEVDAATAAARAAAAAEEAETADERRLRLAKEYLAQLGDVHAAGRDDEEGSEEEDEEGAGRARYDAVSAALRQEALAASGQLFRAYAATVAGSLAGDASPADRVHFLRGHRLAPTCVCISADGQWAWTGSKDCTLLRWDVASAAATAAAAASSSNSSSSGSSRPSGDVRLRYPGRPKTRADVEKQAKLAASSAGGLAGSRPVVGAGTGGGRIGSTTDPDGALAMLTAPKIVKNAADGAQTIIVPVAAKKGGKKGGKKGSAEGADEEDPEAAARQAELDSRRAANADAVAKLRRIPDYGIAGHYDEVLAVAVSSDGQFLVSGGRDRLVRVWETGRAHNVDNFVGHRDAVTGLAFRPGTHTLYSASDDRTVKQWSLDEIAYVDTLFGHQSEITAICPAGAKDRCVTVSRDRSVRLWKVPEQTQLVFRANDSDISVDAVAAIGENWVVSGGQDGSLALWSAMKKRPVATVRQAHGDGVTPPPEAGEGSGASSGSLPLPFKVAAAAGEAAVASAEAAAAAEAPEEEGLYTPGPAAADVPAVVAATGCPPSALSGGYCNWVTTIAHCPGTDLVATGSGDGFIRLWRLVSRLDAGGGPSRQVTFTGIEAVGAIPMPGIVNGLAFAAPVVKGAGAGSLGRITPVLVAAVGQEHRGGRWWRYGSARNGLAVVSLPSLPMTV